MIINTLIENQNRLTHALVEIQLIPGIPQIHFLGLPDKVIKESFFRIKSALKSAGYKFPISQQVIVNIRPNSLKKSSLGLELAVAMGILHLTGQKEISEKALTQIIYGELDLDGGVREPEDLVQFKNSEQFLILTGKSEKPGTNFSRLNHLNDEVQFEENQNPEKVLLRPDVGLKEYYTKDEAELIFLMSSSGLHTLLAGQAGAGKSFLAKRYPSFYNIQNEDTNLINDWYPVIAPHHSLTPAAFLGGTAQLVEGEIEKVENGILILDELLEFNSQILESLREPMTGQILRIARAGRVKEIKPSFQVVATSNFCHCGKWVPEIKYISCRFSVQKCKSNLNRLSGPLVDRFGLIYFHKLSKTKRTVSGFEILNRIQNYQQKVLSQPSATKKFDIILYEKLYSDLSGRRQQALLKIAEIYATEASHDQIELADFKRSEIWTVQGFLQLEKGMC